jgi:hypothetical protein
MLVAHARCSLKAVAAHPPDISKERIREKVDTCRTDHGEPHRIVTGRLELSGMKALQVFTPRYGLISNRPA